MEKIILVVHVLTALSIIALILLQQGKGAEAGASFGAGASQTVFGSAGGGNFFTRATALLAAVFFVTSFGLAVVAKQQATSGLVDGIPVVEEAADIPAAVDVGSDVPQGDIPAANSAADVPEVDGDDVPEGDLPAEPEGEVPQ
ncbi:preprotein translocase subunit SecG [Pseudomaricurvus sp.]|uniref:preprotein translocase subunit SecG n=1 Tax=Pseudomaricurvus sp. TaxID=2004510 RepID=UPI003F6D3E69